MTAVSTDAGPDRQRADELTELLGHLAACWDDERRVLARQMHDSLGSSMTALTMHLALLTQQLPAEKNLHDRAAQMKQILLNVINTNRQMQQALWNDKLEFLGVKAAIGDLVVQFGAEHQLSVQCSLPEDDPVITKPQGVALLRALEEALANVVAHAQASAIEVVLDDNEEAAMLTVRDNGIGGAAIVHNGCHGLRMVRERARYLGGTLALAANVPHGSVLTVTLPKTGV